MVDITSPAEYEAWYHTARGKWIGETEFATMMKLLQPKQGFSLLDIGCGTGYFSRLFAKSGLQVKGIDPNFEAIEYARGIDNSIGYFKGSVMALPFVNHSFDYCAAVTSLCFVDNVEHAIKEMWRVARKGIILGLLNRHSMLYIKKHSSKSYQGARWDTCEDTQDWGKRLKPRPVSSRHRTSIFNPAGQISSRFIESFVPGIIPWGGFLAVVYKK